MPDSQVQFNSEKYPIKKVFYEGTDTLREGYALCYNADTLKVSGASDTTAALVNTERVVRVEKPASGNLAYFAGVVSDRDDGKTGPTWITIVQPAAHGVSIKVWTDANATINSTKLYLKADSYALGSDGARLVAEVLQTIDRSTTAGTVQASLYTPVVVVAESARSRATIALPTQAIWDNFPLDVMRKNPFLGSLFETDLTHGQGYPVNRFTDTTGLIELLGTINGELLMFSSADNDAASCQWDCPIDIDGGAKWAFEARIKQENIDTDVAAWFVGLTPSIALDGDVIADNGATLTDRSYLGFSYDAGATTPVDVLYRLAGQSANEHDAAVITMEATTYVTFGMYFDGTDIQTFANGVNISAPILGTGDMDQADFPLAAIMHPIIELKGLNVADYDFTVDWVRFAQAPA